MLGGMLLLPEGIYFDAPWVPPFGKHELSATCAFLGLLIRAPTHFRQARLFRGVDVLLLVLLPATLVTVLLNRQPLAFGPMLLPAMAPRDILAFSMRGVVQVGFPFLLGRVCVQSARDARMLARVVVTLGLLYSVLMVFEMIFSPNLHRWVYGYHARPDFSQTIRWGGYRPTVFMEHGLAVALFALVVTLFAASDGRACKWRFGLPAWLTTAYAALMLVLCKSTGALIMGSVTLPAIVWLSARKQIMLAALFASLCLAYPLVKVAGAFPAPSVVEVSRRYFGADRAGSLAMRFANEDLMVEHARARLWFGWGGSGRNRLYDEGGGDVVVTDGYWIILLTSGGVMLLACVFGLLLVPVIMAARAAGHVRDGPERILLAGLALVTACCAFDLLPNGLFSFAPLFYAGALARLSAELPREAPAVEVQSLFPEATG
jgi:hypothetical protein